jgi:dihydrofolate synthase / folylpolyglutamate synthase
MQQPEYRETIKSLYSLERKLPPRQYLKGLRALLAKLGNPERDFESVIVTGTNGKGSVTAMTASALRRSGFRAGRYVSPHVDDFCERMCVNDRPIPRGRVSELYSEVAKAASNSEPVTFFEFITAMAFSYFSQERVDFAVLEVGLGGRLDATNLSKSRLGAITAVELEHTQVLGNTLEKIAFEKAGIVRRNGSLVTAERKREPLRAIKSACGEKGAELVLLGRDFRFKELECSSQKNSYEITGRRDTYRVSLSMLGRHQGANAALAAVLAEQLGAPPASIERGIGEARLPCRLELVQKRPLLLMDCAHNPNAARALSDSLGMFKRDRLIMVVGLMADKDKDSFFRHTCRNADILIVNQPAVRRAEKLWATFEGGRRHCQRIIGVKNPAFALRVAKKLAGDNDLICAAGSIYMLSEMRGHPPGVAQ